MTAHELPPFWVVIPAAGIGSRMRADRPKQYLQLAGRTILEHTLDCFLDHPRLKGLVLSLAADDPFWPALPCATDPRIQRVEGGAERADSVLAGLLRLVELGAQEGDWVLVHDAARPCLSLAMLDALFSELAEDPVGGILAVPVADTIKRADSDQRVAATEPRDGLWQAQTPQMFRYGVLSGALAMQRAVTDEAGAIEAAGLRPKLVKGDATNLKVTYPADLPLAELIMMARRGQ